MMAKETSHDEVRVRKCRSTIQIDGGRRKESEEDYAVVYKNNVQAKDDVATSTHQVTKIESKIANLRTDIKGKKKRWKLLRDHASKITRMTFLQMLSIMDWAGDLALDHESKTLNVSVQKISSSSEVPLKDD